MGDSFPSAKGSTQLSVLTPTFVGGSFTIQSIFPTPVLPPFNIGDTTFHGTYGLPCPPLYATPPDTKYPCPPNYEDLQGPHTSSGHR